MTPCLVVTNPINFAEAKKTFYRCTIDRKVSRGKLVNIGCLDFKTRKCKCRRIFIKKDDASQFHGSFLDFGEVKSEKHVKATKLDGLDSRFFQLT